MISIVIPFRPASQQRQEIFDFVLTRYTGYWPEAELIIADSEDDEFSRGASINRGVERAEGDIIVLADADTICNPRALEQATYMCAVSKRWVLPYGTTGYYNLDPFFSEEVLARDALAEISPDDENFGYVHRIESWSGLLVMTKEAFNAVNGFDERFQGWGYEDNAFRLAMDVLWGPYLRVEDENVFHIYHDVPEDGAFNSPNLQKNRDRYYNKYMKARTPDQMKRLVEGNR